MASNINPSTASFSTVNMRPAANEAIDALWGQNIADNTGYLFNLVGASSQAIMGPQGVIVTNGPDTVTTTTGTWFFQYNASKGTLVGSFSGTAYDNLSDNAFKVANSVATTIWSKSNGGNITGGTRVPLYGMTSGSFYKLIYDFNSNIHAGNFRVRCGYSFWFEG